MQLDDTLKHLLQVCADIQDGLWMAAANAKRDELPGLFQNAAVQWNSFADQIFAILLSVDHTSPDAKWKANPNRTWLNHYEDASAMGDRRLCQECLTGLGAAQADLRNALAIAGHPRVRTLVDDQLKASSDQMAGLRVYVSDAVERSIRWDCADTPGGDPSIH